MTDRSTASPLPGKALKILVCGSRTWTQHLPVAAALEVLAPACVIHGDAQGPDRIAGGLAMLWGLRVEVFPADWNADSRSAGPKRNARMLAEGKPDRGLAFGALWKRDTFSRSLLWRHTGTGDMVAKMLRAGLPVRWVTTPDAAAVDLVAMPEPSRIEVSR